jgi:hypothetical protein
MKRGDQIAYLPDHATGLLHPDVEFGFITSISPIDNEYIFCRYWLKGKPGILRTTANSESTHIRNLILYESVPIERVQEILEEI